MLCYNKIKEAMSYVEPGSWKCDQKCYYCSGITHVTEDDIYVMSFPPSAIARCKHCNKKMEVDECPPIVQNRCERRSHCCVVM